MALQTNLSFHYVWYCILLDLKSIIIPQAFTLHRYHWKPFYDLYIYINNLYIKCPGEMRPDQWLSRHRENSGTMVYWKTNDRARDAVGEPYHLRCLGVKKSEGSRAIGNHPQLSLANEWRWFEFEHMVLRILLGSFHLVWRDSLRLGGGAAGS